MYEICYVIPTYNRLEQVKRTIAQLINVNDQCGIDYFIYLVDNSSTIETNSFFINFSHPRLLYQKRKISIPNGNLSLHTILTEVDVIADWYWWMGDDDYVLLEGLRRIKELIKYKDISYIHASDITNIPVKQELKDIFGNLVVNIGLLDITSFMTSQIFRKVILNRIVEYFVSTTSNWEFNFNQSLFLSRALWQEQGVVLSTGVVVAQNKIHIESELVNCDASKFYESLKGWFNLSENITVLEKYVNVRFPIDESFFNFQGKPIWYSFFKWIINHNLVSNSNILQEDYERIMNLISLASSKNNKKSLRILELINIASQLKSFELDQNDQEILEMIKISF